MYLVYYLRCFVQMFAYYMQKTVVKKRIFQDLQRYGEKSLAKALLYHPNFRATFYYRIENRYIRKLCKMTLAPPTNIELWGDIGGGLLLYHKMGCTVLAKHIGRNCTILQGVTIGKGKETDLGCLPYIGNNVTIYTNAVVIGGITVGDNAQIAAGAVVTHDVPAGAVVAGVPAKIIKLKEE